MRAATDGEDSTFMADLILRGKGASAVLPEAGVLLAYGSICFTIGIRMFKFRSVR
ncbi:MAG: hypothetical protein ACYC5A_01880 [Thermoleophilia bacterium]